MTRLFTNGGHLIQLNANNQLLVAGCHEAYVLPPGRLQKRLHMSFLCMARKDSITVLPSKREDSRCNRFRRKGRLFYRLLWHRRGSRHSDWRLRP